uniref:[RNA-polymerase]-subunit kinase n=1 Tax=Auxenochlorella protothecoides TaxID=3075 RepID=A0A1D1ZS62_AUXPR
MENYTKGPLLGKGTFGEVLQGTHKETGELVAIKKIRVGEKGEGVNVTALREVKLLRELHHPNIVRLLDVWPSRRGIALVFEYMETDLERVIRDRAVLLTGADVKAYLRMVLAGLAHCHARWVVHRDVKPDNFLLASSGALKLADFGLARPYGSPDRPFTHQVFARWYRAPELLYGSTCYGPGVDVWAAGCIFAELLLRRPWFSAESDVGVLNKIFTALGTPRDANWGGLRAMPAFVEFQPTPPAPLRSLFPNVAVAPDDALDLLSRMVCLAPAQRISAADALRHRYFRVDPAPTPQERLPKPGRAGVRVAAAAASAKRPGGEREATPAAEAGGPAPAGMDSGDVRFLKKRRLQMDAALDDAADA